MTSNVGSQYVLSGLDGFGSETTYEAMKNRVMDAARTTFRPEFMNRVDEYIVFQALDRDQISSIVRLQLDRVQKRLDSKKITLEVSDTAVELLANIGYDPSYGARPVKRVIQQSVENELAKGILRGDFLEDDKILVDTTLTAIGGASLPQLKLSFTKVPSNDSPQEPDVDPPKYAASSISA